jgi:hypothetical protein
MQGSYRSAPALLLLAVLAGGCGKGIEEDDARGTIPSWARDRELMAAEIVVDLTGVRGGWVPVEVTAYGGHPTHFTFRTDWSDLYALRELRFRDGAGRSLEHREERGRYRVERGENETVIASYLVEPGGLGRHGKQGVIAADHATFDGRLFLLPEGAVPLGSARVRFLVPEGWSVAGPFREEEGWYYVDAFEPQLTAIVLGSSCVGLGLLEQTTRRMGTMEVRVASYAGWEAAHRKALADKTLRLVQYFHERLGFDLGAPYSVVWVPKQGGRRVIGGSFSNGTCFEHPQDRERNWELLAHRLAHAMNKYQPSGMRIRDEQDRWFEEGWASYMEARATREVGLVNDDARWESLLSRYRRTRQFFPERDLPLAREGQSRDESREYLHYVKAPLALKMLEVLVASRSGRTLEQFMAAMWQRYGRFAKPFPFREELEKFTGAAYDEFWSVMVARRGWVVPTWPSYLTATRLRMARQPAAATVDEEPLQGGYLHHLASSGDFRTFDELARFVAGEGGRRRLLDQRGIELYPAEIRRQLGALEPADRYALARLEAAFPLERTGGAARQSRGADDRAQATLEPNRETRDGRILAELLTLEREAGAAGRRGERPRISVQIENPWQPGNWRAVLGCDDRQPIRVEVSRRGGLEAPTVALLSDGREVVVKPIERERSSVARTIFSPQERPSGDRVVLLRLDVEAGPPVLRAFWQRSALPATAAELAPIGEE